MAPHPDPAPAIDAGHCFLQVLRPADSPPPRPRAVVEVAQLWFDTVLAVRTVDRGAGALWLRDRPAAAKALFTALILGELVVVAITTALWGGAPADGTETTALHASALAATAALLATLPLAIVADRRRTTEGGDDFVVYGEALPTSRFPLVETRGDAVILRLPPDAPVSLWSAGRPRSRAEMEADPRHRVVGGLSEWSVQDGEWARIELGPTTFIVHSTWAEGALPARPKAPDRLFAAVLLLCISTLALVGAVLRAPFGRVGQSDLDRPVVETILSITEPPPASPDAGATTSTEGRAAGSAEQRPRAAPRARRAPGPGASQAARSALDQLFGQLDEGLFAAEGLGSNVVAAADGLIGTTPTGGVAGGVRRGSPGGGGGAETIGGIALADRGSGGPHGTRKPGLGARSGGAPGVSASDPVILGPIDRSLIDRVVKQHLGAIRHCYQRELATDPTLTGKVKVKFMVARDGTVSAASTTHDSLGSEAATSCILQQFRRMRFPTPRGGGLVSVQYPFVFGT